jgi:hypothetical protein
MFFARDKGLFDLLLPHYGPVAMQEVQDAFNLMGLPMPDQMEYRDTTDVGALVLLNPYGCTIRVTNRQKLLCETALRHPRLLQPLGTFPDTKLKIDVYPGITSLGEKDSVSSDLTKELEACGLDPVDAMNKSINCGVLANGYTVVLDIPAVTKKHASIDDDSIIVPENALQQRLYGHLRTAFTEALDTKNFESFWSVCATEYQNGLLKSCWVQATDNPVHYPAAAYERRLAQTKNVQPHYPAHFQGYNLGALL